MVPRMHGDQLAGPAEHKINPTGEGDVWVLSLLRPPPQAFQGWVGTSPVVTMGRADKSDLLQEEADTGLGHRWVPSSREKWHPIPGLSAFWGPGGPRSSPNHPGASPPSDVFVLGHVDGLPQNKDGWVVGAPLCLPHLV